MAGPFSVLSKLGADAMHDDDRIEQLEAELAALVEELRPGGTQAHCEALRAKIAEVRRQIEHRERNTAFVRDTYMDD
jgi:ribosome-interacting GTPase 1